MTSIDRLWKEARRHEASGRREQAIECYEHIRELHREADGEHEVDPSLYLSLGDLYYRVGSEEKALRDYQRAAARYVALGNPRNAESLQNLCLRLFPHRSEPHLKLAELYFRLGQDERAHEHVSKVAEAARNASDDEELAREIRRYVTSEARDLFTGRVIGLLRDQPSLRPLIPDGAETVPTGASSTDEMPPWLSDDAPGVEGIPGEDPRELEHGLEVVEEMLEVDPDRVDLLQRRAIYARKLGDRDRLIEAWLDLADGIRAERGSRGARLLYHRVLEFDSENERALTALRPVDRAAVRAAAEGGSPQAAADAFEANVARGDFEERILREFSDEADPLRWLEAAAESALSAGTETKDRSLEFYEFFGRYLMARGRWSAAASVLEKGLSLHHPATEEEQAECRFALGLALRQMGRDGEAREQFERLAELEPGFRRAWESVTDPAAG